MLAFLHDLPRCRLERLLSNLREPDDLARVGRLESFGEFLERVEVDAEHVVECGLLEEVGDGRLEQAGDRVACTAEASNVSDSSSSERISDSLVHRSPPIPLSRPCEVALQRARSRILARDGVSVVRPERIERKVQVIVHACFFA